jgi:GTPase SAR1 family protein
MRRECLADGPTCSQVFLGDQSVGKTSIITRFMYDKFDNTYQVWPVGLVSRSVAWDPTNSVRSAAGDNWD